MELRRRRWENRSGGTDAVVDDLIDLAACGVSLAVREMCCRIGTSAACFARAAANLDRLAQLRLSDEKLRQLVENEGRAVIAWQEHEQLEFDFDARTCLTDQTGDGTIQSRVYVGIDGFMLPVVTDGERAKRHAKAVARRRGQKRKPGRRRPKLVVRRGADQRYKEMKLITMYDQPKVHRLTRATRLGVDKASRLLRQMSADVKLKQAGQIVAVTDGAEWIRRLIEKDVPARATVILDYYHAAQHVHQARRTVFGEEDAKGHEWAGQLLDQMLNGDLETWWERLNQTRSKLRSTAKRKALDELMRYLQQRSGKVDYAKFKAAGMDIGSGPTESMCKSLSRRMKGIGMRWTARNAESMVALEALHQSNLWKAYWSTRLAA